MDCNLSRIIQDNLRHKSDDVINDIIGRESNGFIVDDCEVAKITNISMLEHAVENEALLTHNQRHKVNLTVNKLIES